MRIVWYVGVRRLSGFRFMVSVMCLWVFKI